MKLSLLLGGVLAWIGVVAISLLMAEWEEPVWGFFPIAAAVLGAWAVGEYITDQYLSQKGGGQ